MSTSSDPAPGEPGATGTSEFDTGPGPRAGAFFLAYAAVILGGVLGALIGYGITDIDCTGECGTATAIGALVGGVVGAVGTGVVAVLALRAMAEWRRPH